MTSSLPITRQPQTEMIKKLKLSHLNHDKLTIYCDECKGIATSNMMEPPLSRFREMQL